MGASSALRDVTGAKTVIHKLDADIIRTGKNPKLHARNAKGKIIGHFLAEKVNNFVPYEPEIVLKGEMSLYDYGIEGKIIETPGHTNGSISVVLKSGNVFVGDLIMGGMFRKGKPSFPMFADNIEKLKDSIRNIISLSPKTVFIGHGGPFLLEDIIKGEFK
jgi:glyoxylase-like metal-dependent hydrolase (beta-lactamase superfamily II)